MKASMSVRFWGVRGSIPSPGPTTVRYGGNSPCVTIDLGSERTLVFDAGTGIRKLGDALVESSSLIYIVLSHVHWDHVQGYPFFAPIYQPDREIHLIPTMPDTSLFDVLFRQMDGAHFPVNADTLPSRCRYVTGNAMLFLREHGFTVSRIATNHPGGCYGYRVENAGRSVIYISDNELVPPGPATTSISQFVSFCQDADILIHDSQYVERDMPHKHGWGHSLISQVRELAAAARVKQLVLFHHDPERSDDELDGIQDETGSWLRRRSQTESCVAYEGLELSV